MDKLNTRLQAIADGYTKQGLYAGIGWRVEQTGNTIASNVPMID